jgi:hypothetical protein
MPDLLAANGSKFGGRLDRVILFVVAFLLLAVGSFWGLPSGKAVAGALVILDGGVPYRDFWTMYAPASSTRLRRSSGCSAASCLCRP